MRLVFLCIFLLSLSPASARMSEPSSKHVEDLLLLAKISDTKCRGEFGSAAQDACLFRDNTFRELEALGYCYGKKKQIGAEMAWHRCTADSLRTAKPLPQGVFYPSPAEQAKRGDSVKLNQWYVTGLPQSEYSKQPICQAIVSYWYGTFIILVDLTDTSVKLIAQKSSWSFDVNGKPFLVDLAFYENASGKPFYASTFTAQPWSDDTFGVPDLNLVEFRKALLNSVGISVSKQGGVPLEISIPDSKAVVAQLNACRQKYHSYSSN